MHLSVRSFYSVLFMINPNFTEVEKRNILPFLLILNFPVYSILRLLGITETYFFSSLNRVRSINLVVYDKKAKVYYFNTHILFRNMKYPSSVLKLVLTNTVRLPRLFLIDKKTVLQDKKNPIIVNSTLYTEDIIHLFLDYSLGCKKIKFGNFVKGVSDFTDSFIKKDAVSLMAFWDEKAAERVSGPYVKGYSGIAVGKFKNLLKVLKKKEILRAINSYHSDSSSYLLSVGHPIALFFSQINKYVRTSSLSKMYSSSFYDVSPEEDIFYKDTVVEIRMGKATLKDAKYVRDKQKHFCGKVKKSVNSYIKSFN